MSLANVDRCLAKGCSCCGRDLNLIPCDPLYGDISSRPQYLYFTCAFHVSFQIIDDSLFEEQEEFEIALVMPSFHTRIGSKARASVIIDGPNDGESVTTVTIG